MTPPPVPSFIVDLSDALAAENPTAPDTFHALLRDARTQHSAIAPPVTRNRESEAFRRDFLARNGERAPQNTVLLIADSIGMPRPDTGVAATDTYGQLMHSALAARTDGRLGAAPDCARGRTVLDALRVADAYSEPHAAIVIQLGIVDCAPRVFSPADINAITRIYGDATATRVIELAREYRPQLERDRIRSPYVPLSEFRPAYERLLRKCAELAPQVTATTIVTPSRKGLKMSSAPLAQNIDDYNAAVIEAASAANVHLVDLDAAIWRRADAADCFTRDNYHYNRVGHRYVAFELSHHLADRLNLKPEPAPLG